jgi:imidazolonepropionase-like amidohydrolase
MPAFTGMTALQAISILRHRLLKAEHIDSRTNMNTNFNSISTKLRSVVKGMSMGDYITPLSKTSPLLHEINNAGKRIAFTNCNIFDGVNPTLKENMIVLIEGDKIFDIGHKEQMKAPENFRVVDMEGGTIMPGLIDCHVHQCSPFTYQPNADAVRQMPIQIALNNMREVYSGVTTICDMGGPQGIIKEFTKLADENRIPGPRYLNSYTLISPKKGKNLGYPSQVKPLNPFKAWVLEGQVATRPETLEDLKRVCYKVKDDGGAHLKTTYQPHPFSRKKYASQDAFPVFEDDWMRTIFKIGKETGLVVDIHSPYSIGSEKCVDLAIEVDAKIRIQHMTFDTDMKDTVIQKMHDYGLYLIPTVLVFADSFHMPEFIAWLDTDPKGYMMPEANRQIRARIKNGIDLETYTGQMVMEHDYAYFREQFDFVKRNTQKAHNAGIIGFGTDIGGTNTGFFGRIYSEIMYYVEFGISSIDILKYLTSVNAEINGLNDRGIIQPGKLADIIAVDGNPLLDISVLREAKTVMKGGVFLKYKGTELTSPLR